MTYFKIGNEDFSSYVKSLKVNMEVIVADTSGRNASGTMCLDIVNRKDKLNVTFVPMKMNEMNRLLAAIEDYIITVSYLNPRDNQIKTI